MQTLVIALFILSVVSFSMQLQFFSKKWMIWPYLALIAGFVYAMHYLAIEQSYKSFRAILGNSSVMMDFVVIQVIEALGGLLMAVFLIRSYYNEPIKKFFKPLMYLPGIIVFPALFYFESMVFLQAHTYDFQLLAAVLAISAVALILTLKMSFKKLIPEMELQLEMKFIIHLLQLLGGIVLSVLMLRLPVQQAVDHGFSLNAMLVLGLVILVGTLMGMLWYRYKMKRLSKTVL